MKKAKSKPIYLKLLGFIILMLIGESVLLGSAVFGGGILRYMRTNEKNVFHERVVNRKNYLEEQMRLGWSDIEDSVHKINGMTARLLSEGKISKDTLDKGSAESMPLLEEAANELIALIRTNKVTGAFLVLNTENLEELSDQGIYEDKPGLYLRDYDPVSRAWERDQDLLWDYAPAEFIRNQELTLDSEWKPVFEFSDMKEYRDYLYEPYQAALEMEKPQSVDLTDLGYWGTSQCSCSNKKAVITYSMPLILEDGTVYGVLGIDLLADYVKKQMPYQELLDSDTGSYLLGIGANNENTVKNVLIAGNAYENIKDQDDQTVFYKKKNQIYVENQKKKLCAEVEYLELYNQSSPFYGQKWALAGIVKEDELFQFSNHVIQMLCMMFAVIIAVAVAGGFLVSRYISKPIMVLANNVQKAKPTEPLSLTLTGIQEIDILAGALERQSDRLNHVMEKFSHVINMAEIPLAVFEINRKDQTVFITEKMFDIFGLPQMPSSELTVTGFWEMLDSLEQYKELDDTNEDGEILYRIPMPEDKQFPIHYIRMMVNDNGNSYIGFVENVTEQILERKQIEYERNHDLLTGLMNRRAFDEQMKRLCTEENKKKLKTAAFVMMDLDELKHINDTYGHTYGDHYIQSAAKCFLRVVPASTVICRLAGDEFCMFFYGYENPDEIRIHLEELMDELKKTKIQLPDNGEFPIELSGGVAWYPQDGTTYEQLLQCADSAMYSVKKSGKGSFREFHVGGKIMMKNQPRHRETILIVDDMEINRDILGEMLKDEYYLMEASDGEEAIELLEKYRSKIDLILLDLIMPGKNGFEVLKVMNEQRWIEKIPVIMISSENSPDFMKRVYEQGGTDYICRPFDVAVVRQRVKNTLMLYAKQKRLEQMVADQVYEQEKYNDMMLSIFSNIVEFRNGESGLHVLHIRIITELICRYLAEETGQIQLSEKEIAEIATASSLHDVGKIAIAEEILNKPGKLTAEEFEIMKTHAAIGASMVENLEQYREEPLVRLAHDICRWHHERWDGKGYPDGLKGDEIPIAAQIVALADVYDALTSERVYKKAFTGKEAVQMIIEGKCGAFNPILLDALKELEEDIKESLRKSDEGEKWTDKKSGSS